MEYLDSVNMSMSMSVSVSVSMSRLGSSAPTRVRLLGQAVCGGNTSPSQPVQARRDGNRSPIHVMAPSKATAFGHLWALPNTLSVMSARRSRSQ